MYTRKNLPPIAAAALLAGLCKISAAVPPELLATAGVSESEFFSELPVVLSVSRLAQPTREAPGAVTVIDAATIRQIGARSLGDVLRLVPGFQVAETHRGAPYFVYHGGTSEEPRGLQVLIDGRTQYSPSWFGGVNFNTLQVAIEDIDYIEVLRGSNSAAFGANAFLGVVNVVTKPAAQTRGVALLANSGNAGIEDRYARVGWGSESANYRLSFDRRRDAGLRRYYDSRYSDMIDARADLQLGNRDALEVRAGGVSVRQGDGYSGRDNFPELQPEHNVKLKNYWGQLTWRRELGDQDGLQARYFTVGEHHRDRYEVDISPLIAAGLLSAGASGLIDNDIHVVRHDVELQHTVELGGAMRAVWGAGFRADRVSSQVIYSRADWLSNDVARIFGNLEWRFRPSWVANLGASWDHETLSGTHFAPRLMLNHHLDRNQTVRAGVTRAYRTPSLYEQRANSSFGFEPASPLFGGLSLPGVKDQISTGRAKAESIQSVEVGYLGEFKSIGLVLDVRGFREHVRDRIIPQMYTVSTTTPCEALPDAGLCGAQDFINAQSYRIRGGEYQVRWAPVPATQLIFNQTFIDIESELHAVATDPAIKKHIDESAPSRLESLTLLQRFGERWNASATYLQSKGYKWTNNATVPAYHRLDWRLAYAFKLAGARGEAAYTVRADGGPHAEFRDKGNLSPLEWDETEPIHPRHYFTLRLEY